MNVYECECASPCESVTPELGPDYEEAVLKTRLTWQELPTPLGR